MRNRLNHERSQNKDGVFRHCILLFGVLFMVSACGNPMTSSDSRSHGEETRELNPISGSDEVTEQASGNCLPDTICVPLDYPTIQEAVDMAVDGETVLIVEAGEYHENLELLGLDNFTLKKDVGVGEVTIVAQDPGSPAIYVLSGSNITIEGLSITGTSQIPPNRPPKGGIYILSSIPELTIRNCKIFGNSYGIVPTVNTTHLMIEDNIIENNGGGGIHYVSNTGSFSGNVIRKNVFRSNYANAIYFPGDTDNSGLTIEENQFFEHGEISGYNVPRSTIYLSGPNHMIRDNSFENDYRAILSGGNVENTSILDNQMGISDTSNENYGLEGITWSGLNSTISNNRIAGFSVAVHLEEDSENNEVRSNRICGSRVGVQDEGNENTVLNILGCKPVTHYIPTIAMPEGFDR